jgi:2-polyprenyl-3-methyl-5-hydroxy-6-metoxy-1,4-benzoquinol methylase
MNFDYKAQTKNFYKSSAVADHYHRAFTSRRGPDAWRHRFIAARERMLTKSLLSQVPHRTVVDLPAGTGKMAPVYQSLGCDVLACDVSSDMLEIAKVTYRESGCTRVRFECVDLESADTANLGKVDVLVCIRLMHRVPNDVKRRMLEQIARRASHAVVSFAVDSLYQRLRLSVREAVFRTRDVGVETRESRHDIERTLGEYFAIKNALPVSQLFSSEWLYLLESRTAYS